MKIKKIAVLVGMGVAFSGVAQATVTLTPAFNTNDASVQTYDVGTLIQDETYVGAVALQNSFQHKWSFDIPSAMWTGGSVVNLSIKPMIDIQNLDVALYTKNDVLIQGVTCAGESCTGSGFFPSADVDYYFLVKGKGVGSQNGSGIYTFSMTTAVPESETWAMMLAGLGLVGLQLRRKSKVAKEIAVN